jgi:hypothetical protein
MPAVKIGGGPSRETLRALRLSGVSRFKRLTIEDLLSGKGVDAPPMYGAFKQAERVPDEGGDQLPLEL